MTSKEAFETLKRYEAELSITKQTEVAYDVVISARYEISKLVERDTPMIPIKLKWKNTENYYYVCPKCEEMVARTDEVFCQDCGQRLDWSDDEIEKEKENK